MAEHGSQFAAWGLKTEQAVADFILKTVGTTPAGQMVRDATIFSVTVGDKARNLAVVIGSNGYIVSAYPWSH
jgi:hypothetical protein